MNRHNNKIENNVNIHCAHWAHAATEGEYVYLVNWLCFCFCLYAAPYFIGQLFNRPRTFEYEIVTVSGCSSYGNGSSINTKTRNKICCSEYVLKCHGTEVSKRCTEKRLTSLLSLMHNSTTASHRIACSAQQWREHFQKLHFKFYIFGVFALLQCSRINESDNEWMNEWNGMNEENLIRKNVHAQTHKPERSSVILLGGSVQTIRTKAYG